MLFLFGTYLFLEPWAFRDTVDLQDNYGKYLIFYTEPTRYFLTYQFFVQQPHQVLVAHFSGKQTQSNKLTNPLSIKYKNDTIGKNRAPFWIDVWYS